MKKTLFALAVALFCTTATTQAQHSNRGHDRGYDNGTGYSNNGSNTHYYGDDRDPWHDGRQAYDRRQYNRNWVVVRRGRRNHPPQGHWVYVQHAPQRYYAPPPPPARRYRQRYNSRPGFVIQGRW